MNDPNPDNIACGENHEVSNNKEVVKEENRDPLTPRKLWRIANGIVPPPPFPLVTTRLMMFDRI